MSANIIGIFRRIPSHFAYVGVLGLKTLFLGKTLLSAVGGEGVVVLRVSAHSRTPAWSLQGLKASEGCV